MTEYVEASPAKRFFVEMLIRDIRLEDAILDLVDNAIDSLIRHDNIDLEALVFNLSEETLPREVNRSVRITIENEKLCVIDNCGGIEFDHAKEHVFRFGAQQKPKDAHLSVYGIGLKRAVLKIGRMITVESRTLHSGFRVTMDVDEFEANHDDWRFPIERLDAATAVEECGTAVEVSNFTEETKSRLRSGSFQSNLVTSIGESYSLFLQNFVTVQLNSLPVPPVLIPMSSSEEISTSLTKETFEDVRVTIVTGLQALDGKDWRGHTAGWYIICNGRVVVFADKTGLTGWGSGSLPGFQPKHRGFIGIALFMSEDPEALPWTTTKRGVNAESAVFQYIKEKMIMDARPVIRFLDKRYASVPVSSENTDRLEVRDKPLQTALQPVVVNKLFGDSPRPFSATRQISQRAKTTSVQFRTESKNIEKARRALGDPRMAAGKVGSYALEYFLRNEAEE